MMCELRHHFCVPCIHTKKNEQQVQMLVLVLISVFMDRVLFACCGRRGPGREVGLLFFWLLRSHCVLVCCMCFDS
jgi:hypothetical protein